MNQFVQPVEGIGDALPLEPMKTGTTAQPVQQFGQWFTQELASVNSQMVQAEQGVQQMAAGGGVSLHQTMLQLEQARLQFQLVIQVRNRVLEAYQDVMRMQV